MNFLTDNERQSHARYRGVKTAKRIEKRYIHGGNIPKEGVKAPRQEEKTVQYSASGKKLGTKPREAYGKKGEATDG